MQHRSLTLVLCVLCPALLQAGEMDLPLPADRSAVFYFPAFALSGTAMLLISLCAAAFHGMRISNLTAQHHIAASTARNVV